MHKMAAPLTFYMNRLSLIIKWIIIDIILVWVYIFAGQVIIPNVYNYL